MNPIVYSMFKNKCPRCHQGDVFVNHKPFSRQFDQMHTHCAHCELKYEKEPGFFYGAMYVSYAMMVAVFVTLWVLNIWIFHLDSVPFIFLVLGGIVGMMTMVFRGARLLWMNFFIRYNKELDKQ